MRRALDPTQSKDFCIALTRAHELGELNGMRSQSALSICVNIRYAATDPHEVTALLAAFDAGQSRNLQRKAEHQRNSQTRGTVTQTVSPQLDYGKESL